MGFRPCYRKIDTTTNKRKAYPIIAGYRGLLLRIFGKRSSK